MNMMMNLSLAPLLLIFSLNTTLAQGRRTPLNEDEQRIMNCDDFDDNCPNLTRILNNRITGVPCLDLELQKRCPKSCSVCIPKSPFRGCQDLRPKFCAEKLRNRNDCHSNPRIYLSLCARTCQACPPKEPSECSTDMHPSCYLASLYGKCQPSSIFHLVYCPKACGAFIPLCKKNKGKINPSTIASVCNNKNFDCGVLKEAGNAAIGISRGKRQVPHRYNPPSKLRPHAKPPYKPYRSHQRQNKNFHRHNSSIENNKSSIRTFDSSNKNGHYQSIYTNASSNKYINRIQNINRHGERSHFHKISKRTIGRRNTRTETREDFEMARDKALVPFCTYDEFMKLFVLLDKLTRVNSGFPLVDEMEDLILDINFCQHGVNSPFDRKSYVRDIYVHQSGLLVPPSGFNGLQYTNQYEIPTNTRRGRRSIELSLPSKSKSLKYSEEKLKTINDPSKRRRKRQTTDDDGDGKVLVDGSSVSGRSQRGFFRCGGSLITPHHVVTAAHCVYSKRRPQTTRLGERDFSRFDESEAYDYTISSINFHQDYNGHSKMNDIAIILLKHRVDFTDDILPFCLPQTNRNLEGEKCYISGWGERSANAVRQRTILSNVELTILNSKECQRNYSMTARSKEMDLFKQSYEENGLPDSVFCAGGENDLICQGDSGGPANIINDDGKFETVGIVNKGYGCFNRMFPGIYIRISSFTDWIADMLYGDCNDIQTIATSSKTTKSKPIRTTPKPFKAITFPKPFKAITFPKPNSSYHKKKPPTQSYQRPNPYNHGYHRRNPYNHGYHRRNPYNHGYHRPNPYNHGYHHRQSPQG